MTAATDKIRVLCVDDDSVVLALTETVLERLDGSIVVETETDPTAALDRVRTGEFDCVVCDYEMPGLSGLELHDAIREEDSTIPVILFTGAGSEEIASEAIQHGITGYLRKQPGTAQYDLLASKIKNAVERSRTVEELQRKNAAMDEAPVGIVLTDSSLPDNPIVYANEKFYELTGYPEAEVLGRNCRFLQGERTKQEPVDRMRAAIEAREPITTEVRNYRRDGTMFWNEVTIAPVDNSETPYFVGFQHEITRRKLAEQRLRRQNERLSEFTGTVSHDLRGPLAAAMGYLELARAEADDVSFLDDVAAAHQRMKTLIDDLLVLARAGNVIDDSSAVPITEAVEYAWNPPPHVKATLDVQIADDVTVQADENRLIQLFENLLGNSLEHGIHNDDGTETVTITVGLLEDGFFVADDGPGIPPDKREAVFESGYTTNPDGTGLGLRIVQDIVDAHGWDVTVTESDDGGARFEITNVYNADD
ncbi:receiver/sensor box histidine kinase [Natrialba magadii ATCC 43099]|uniref:histidine kinase n=1 Tax=Natrialba magadii (strain ATCC 43099 / DSM 3394 / CCM 3739 / CIP 104546 / IAM 13178 / JCM 8861 / NBRC 102185 / NCIMB 2190 / MS3) TaxID=547559 RepID=D3SVK4_NATMM|nr:response regulator [Natrialba magadii]ADD05612.1 receiver/sensor box histidine kinase [Natrialba magadii ATCC 43099]ELY29975.1 multi-sensor signal transduction histidine kinase [Natrialba magadii ATCC 43099]